LGLVAGTVSTAGMFFTHNAYVFLALRLLAGVAASAWVVFTVLFTGYFEKGKQASRMTYLLIATLSGQMVSKFFGGLLADNFGHEYTFLLGGAAGFLAALLGLFITEQTPQVTELPSVRKLIGAIKNKNLIVMAILAVFTQIVMHSTINTFTSEAAARAGADLIEIGLLATIATIPSIVSLIVCAKLFKNQNINVQTMLIVGFILQLAGALIIPFGNGIVGVYVSTIILGLGCGLCFSTLLSFCTRTVDESQRSTAMGFFQATSDLVCL